MTKTFSVCGRGPSFFSFLKDAFFLFENIVTSTPQPLSPFSPGPSFLSWVAYLSTQTMFHKNCVFTSNNEFYNNEFYKSLTHKYQNIYRPETLQLSVWDQCPRGDGVGVQKSQVAWGGGCKWRFDCIILE